MAKPIRQAAKRALFGEPEPEAGVATTEKEEGMAEGSEKQLRDLLEALEAVRRGDLTKKLKTRREDIFGELADSYNGMVELLNNFSNEVPV